MRRLALLVVGSCADVYLNLRYNRLRRYQLEPTGAIIDTLELPLGETNRFDLID